MLWPPLRTALADTPKDPATHLALGRMLAASQRFEEALEVLIAAVRCDADYEEGAARRAMLDIFEVLGSEHPLTERFRRALADSLFR